MILTYWPISLQEKLRNTYQYNPETGVVSRKVPAVKGPSTVGQVGTLVNGRDMIINVNHEGRQWSVRIAKLAIFLHTGEQYKFVEFVDGDRTNFAISNLYTRGDPSKEEDNDPRMLQAVKDKAIARMKEMKVKTFEHFTKQELAQAEAREELIKETVAKQEKIPIIEDVIREQQAREAEEWAKFCAETGLGELLSLWKEYEDKWKGYRWKHGLATGMSEGQAFRFEQDVEPILGKTCLELYMEKRSDTYTAEDEEKWFHDAFQLGGMQFKAERIGGTVEERLKKYRWKGEEVENKYEELSAEDTVEYVKRKQEIEARLGSTQEELEAKWEERKKALEEMQYARPQE